MSDLDRLDKILRKLNLPKGQYAVFGSCALVLHGILERSFNDVDIFLATRPWLDLYDSGKFRLFTTDPNSNKRCDPPYVSTVIAERQIDIFPAWKSRSKYDYFDVSSLIENAEIVNGWPCVPLKAVLSFKEGRYESRGGYNDRLDSDSIRRYLTK